jgi:uncharacterized protein YheU (UPF0270 family)
MTPDQILEIDAKRNHPEGTSAGHLRALINSQLRQKGHIVQQGDTLIVFSNADEDDDVEYHCFNADTPENLTENVMKFFEMAKKLGYKTATTPYQNPKVSELFKAYVSKRYDVSITKTSDGFEAKARL